MYDPSFCKTNVPCSAKRNHNKKSAYVVDNAGLGTRSRRKCDGDNVTADNHVVAILVHGDDSKGQRYSGGAACGLAAQDRVCATLSKIFEAPVEDLLCRVGRS